MGTSGCFIFQTYEFLLATINGKNQNRKKKQQPFYGKYESYHTFTMYIPKINQLLPKGFYVVDTMIASTSASDFWNISHHGHASATKSRNVYKSSIDCKNIGRCVMVDLIVDVYIDPVVEQHMTIVKAQQNNAKRSSVSPSEKKRYRLQPRECTSIMDTASMNSCESIDKMLVFDNDMEKEGSLCTTKRVKRNIEPPLRKSCCTTEEKWSFVPYPSHAELEGALLKYRGLSQLLAPWETIRHHNPNDSEEHVMLDEDNDGTNVDDVERALFGVHVTSGGWNVGQKDHNIYPHHPYKSQPLHVNQNLEPTPTQVVPDEKKLIAHSQRMTNKASLSDSSSVSSISFFEHEQVPPPTLLRVTTSIILKEQEYIWKQIKRERRNIIQHSHDYASAVWQNEVTRGLNIRPPLSPRSRTYILQPKPSSGGLNEMNNTSDSALKLSEAPLNLCTPPRTNTKTINRIKQESSNLSISHTSSKDIAYQTASGPATVTPQRCDICPVASQVVVSCLECQSPMVLSRTFNSTIVYCSKCGIMASTDLLQSFLHNGNHQQIE